MGRDLPPFTYQGAVWFEFFIPLVKGAGQLYMQIEDGAARWGQTWARPSNNGEWPVTVKQRLLLPAGTHNLRMRLWNPTGQSIDAWGGGGGGGGANAGLMPSFGRVVATQ